MATPQSRLGISPESYLAFERAAEERHEYDNGVITAMAGESPEHSLVNFNLIAVVGAKLRGSACRGYSPNMKVQVSPIGQFFYPDLAVVCGEPIYRDDRRDIVTNPRVVFEVLSPSTERKDRNQKLLAYRQIPSLTDYLLVAQEEPLVEHFAKRDDGQWLHAIYQGLEASFEIAALNCRLSLAEIYERIEFPTPEAEEEMNEEED